MSQENPIDAALPLPNLDRQPMERRALMSVVIELDEGDDPPEVEYEAFTGRPPSELSAPQIRALLVESGEWTAVRARPFDRPPPIDAAPRA